MATGLQVKVGADTTEFRQEIRELPREFEKAEEQISQSAERVGGAIDGALKGLLSAGIVVAMERVIDHFDKIADAASKYGQTAEDIQRVGTAAEMTGGNIESVAMAMERAGVAAAKAARGNEEFVEKFNRAGIDAAAFSAATLTERINMVASAQQSAGNSGDRHAAILEALGDGAANIDFQRIADEMGNVVVASNETVEQLSRANDIMVQAKSTATVFAAEGLGTVADHFERIGSILGEGESGVIGKLLKWIRFSSQFSPAAGAFHMLGFGGETIKEMEDAQKRLNAIALLRSRDNIDKATEEQINAEMRAIEERERAATRATAETNSAIDEGKAKTEQNAQIKQRLLEIQLQLKEAEAAGNKELAGRLRHSEDLYKGILKYKDAEDGYGMAVREANAELAKRNELLNKKTGADGGLADIVKIREDYISSLSSSRSGMSPQELKEAQEISKRYHDLTRQNPELLRFDVQAKLSNLAKTTAVGDPIKAAVQSLIGGSAGQFFEGASLTESERQRAATSASQGGSAITAEADKIATETTLQKVANFLEQLNTKLPQPVLV
jgi:hypothetical protein